MSRCPWMHGIGELVARRRRRRLEGTLGRRLPATPSAEQVQQERVDVVPKADVGSRTLASSPGSTWHGSGASNEQFRPSLSLEAGADAAGRATAAAAEGDFDRRPESHLVAIGETDADRDEFRRLHFLGLRRGSEPPARSENQAVWSAAT